MTNLIFFKNGTAYNQVAEKLRTAGSVAALLAPIGDVLNKKVRQNKMPMIK